MKDPSCQTIFSRTFILEKMPEPLSRSGEHLQIFENYIAKTRLCLQRIRKPKTKEQIFILEQKIPLSENDLSVYQRSVIFLDEREYEVFYQLEKHKNGELRYNRYLYDYQEKEAAIDFYLNDQFRGLILAKFFYDSAEESKKNELPEFANLEVTQNNFFAGQNLFGKTLANIQTELRY